MKFIFGSKEGTPRPDKSIIFKDHVGSSHTLVEVDASAVAKKLGTNEEEVSHMIHAVITSIWRLNKWSTEP